MGPEKLGFTVLIVLVLSVLNGCRDKAKQSEEATQYSIVKGALERHARSLRQKEKQFKGLKGQLELGEQVLESLETYGPSYVTIVPELYYVVVSKPTDGVHGLIIWNLERRSDLVGVRIREFWPGGEVVSEVYELAMIARDYHNPARKEPGWRGGYSFYVTERQNPSVRKDEDEWEKWVIGEIDILSQPHLYLARPSEEVHVLISLIDHAGHESRAVPLPPWLEK